MKKKFTHTKVWNIESEISPKDNFFNHKNIIRYSIVLVSIWLVLFFWKFLINSAKITLWYLWESTIKTVSKNFWKDMIRDDFWNVNILIVWVWWWNHHGSYLADTIILASRNPELWAVTMISIPRDLYVHSNPYLWRVNGLFSRWYNQSKNIWSWAENLNQKVEEILWLTIPYYLVADFQWFKDVVDTLWGIEMYVPETIHDTTYPDENLWYQTFHISAWQQVLDWETALMYARSRHTTSDFSRSHRQQEIIKAIINKAIKAENITNISKLKEIYSTYTKMVHTNISLKEIIWMFWYVYDFEHIFSFGLNTYCNYRAYTITDPWCFLYNWNREAYGWMAVMVPNWSTPSNVSFYDYINRFSFFVAHNQWYLIENSRIIIKNAIDNSYASQKWKKASWRANKVAVKLKKYGFNIQWIDNSQEKKENTTVVIYNDTYDKTIEALQFFFPINIVEEWQVFSWEELDYDMEIFIWNDFIDYIWQTPFSYEK